MSIVDSLRIPTPPAQTDQPAPTSLPRDLEAVERLGSTGIASRTTRESVRGALAEAITEGAERPLEPGDVVRLKSGGPAMTIDDPNYDEGKALCWVVIDGRPQQRLLKSVMLERCEPGTFPGTTDILEIAPGDILVARVPRGRRAAAEVALHFVLDRADITVPFLVLEPGESLSVVRKAQGEEQSG